MKAETLSGRGALDQSPSARNRRRDDLVGLAALVSASVAWVAYFSSRSFFYWDDFLYLRQAQLQGISLGYLFERYPFDDIFSPGHRLGDWLSQTLFPLSFSFAQAFLLLFVAGAVVALFGILTEIVGRARLRWVLSALYATSTVQVAMVASWGNGLLRLTGTCLSLGCIYCYLVYRRTGSSRWVTWSLVFLVGALFFYIKPLLVPIYLVILQVLVLRPDRSVRKVLRDMFGPELGVWVKYVVVLGIYVVVFVGWYWRPSGLPALGSIPAYLGLSWSKAFLPSVAGIYVPTGGVSGLSAALLPLLEVIFAAVVIWSVVRDRRAWRAWTFFAIAFLLNALMVGIPLLRGLGPDIGYRLSYAMEATYLLPIALAAAFRPRSEVVALDSAGPVAGAPGVGRRRWFQRTAWRVAGWVGAACALSIHLVLAWSAAGATVADTPGPQTASYIRHVETSLAAIERRGIQPTIEDGSVPGYVVSTYLLYGVSLPYNRYSQLFKLIDPDLSFGSRGRWLYHVGSDGTLHRVPTTERGSPLVYSDSFDRPDDPTSLGSMSSGAIPWEALAGTWGIANQEAYVSVPAPAGAGDLAVVELTRAVGTVQVRLGTVSPGAGLVFAYMGRGDYWALVAEPYYGTWNVVHVVGGIAKGMGNVGEVPTASDTAVSATIEGHTVALAVDGRVVRTIVSASIVSSRGAGLTAGGARAGQARFEDFSVVPASG